MIEILRTNDPVLLSLVESLLNEAGIAHFVADRNMSVLEGSIGILPRRILVEAERLEDARQVLREADLGQWVKDRD